MRSSTTFAAAALCAALAVPAHAAPPTASSVQQFANCAVKNYEGAELLATQPGSPEEREVIAEFGNRSCATPEVAFGVLRGAVAEQLFKSDFGSIGARPRRDLIEVFTIDSRELAELDEAARRRVDYVAFGTCVAASDPNNSSRLLGTAPDSGEERTILGAMVPHFSSCLAQGERFTFARGDLRSALAEGAYRLALSQSLGEEVVVTGTRDPARSVSCKLQSVPGSRMRQNLCMTEAQWAARERSEEYAREENQRDAREYREIEMSILARNRFTFNCSDAAMC